MPGPLCPSAEQQLVSRMVVASAGGRARNRSRRDVNPIAPCGAGSANRNRRQAEADDQAHSLLAGTSQPNTGAAPAPPFSVWVLYVILTLAKFRLTFSVRRSSPCDPPVDTLVTRMCFISILRYSSGFSPALRTVRIAV